MLVNTNDNRVKYQNELSDLGLAGLRSDQTADRFTTMSKQMWEDQKSLYQPLPTDAATTRMWGDQTKREGFVTGTPASTSAAAQPAAGESVGKSVASRAGGSTWVDTAPTPAPTPPTATSPYYVNPNAGKASDRLGALEKARYEDKKARFDPIENALMQQTTYNNPNLAGQEVGKAEADTMQTYDNIPGSQAIQLGRYGMSMDADQQTSSDRMNALGRTGAVVDAANNIRLKLVERNQSIAAGTATSNLASTK